MIGFGDKKTTAYHGHYKPAEVYGPKMVQTTGKNLFDINAVTGAGGTSSIDAIYDGTGRVSGEELVAEIGLYGSFAIWKGAVIEAVEDTILTVSADVMFPSDSAEGGRSILLGYYYWNAGRHDFYTRRIEEYDVWERHSVSLRVPAGERVSVMLQGIGNATRYTKLGVIFKNVQVEHGEGATEYEPFTGGVPGSASVGTVRYAGWKEVEASGKEIIVENTYDDRLDLTVYGHHEQYAQEEESLHISGEHSSFRTGENSYLKSALFVGHHEQEATQGMQLFNLETPLYVGSNHLQVGKTETGICINNESLGAAAYVFMLNSDVGLKGGKTYTSRTKITYSTATAGGSTAGSMLYVWYLQTNSNFDSSGAKKYQVFGKSYFNQNGVCFSTFTLPEDLTGYEYIVTRVSGYSKIVFEDMQLVEGIYTKDNFPEYEPFTGGKPSPNPDYPQTIHAVEEETLSVHGKNLLNFPQHYETYGYQNPVSQETKESLYALVPGKQYHVSRNYTYAEKYEGTMRGQFLVKDASGASVWFGNNPSLILNDRITDVIGFYCESKADADGTPTIVENFQIEEGTAVTEYEPYIPEQTYGRNQSLFGDDEICDSLDLVKGKLTRRWGSMVMTGADRFGYTDTNNWLTLVTGKVVKDREKAICTHLMNEIGGASQNSFWWDSELSALRFSIDGFSSLEEYKHFFTEQYEHGTPVTIYYPLASEIVEATDPVDISLRDYCAKTTLLETDNGFSGTVVLKPQMPSPQFSSEIAYLDGCTVRSSGKNLFDLNGDINNCLYVFGMHGGSNKVKGGRYLEVWNGGSGYLYGQPFKGLPEGKYTASATIIDNGDSSLGSYYGVTINGRIDKATRRAFAGDKFKYTFELSEKDWMCFFFGLTGAALETFPNGMVYGNIQVERGSEVTSYEPYFAPSQQELPFELFGNGEVNDTCEPCVLVDGEWRCRVTRRWWKVDLEKYRDILVGIYKKKDDVTCFTMSQIGLYTSEPAKINGWQTSICSHFKNVNGSYDRFVPGLYSDQPSLTGMYFTVENIYTVEEFRRWYIENKVVTMYQTAKPVIELYDPLPLRTIPRYTHISNNAGAEMSAKLKVVDV